MKIRETIHHGDYRNVRDEDVDATVDAIAGFMTRSPYAAGSTVDSLKANEYAADAIRGILTTGKGQHGWADYQVIA